MKTKLQKQIAYKYKDKQHFKHVIIIPNKAITELCWTGGQEIELTINNGKITLTPLPHKGATEQ